jgi:hypothetical protein
MALAFFFFFFQHWGLNSGFYACKAGAPTVEPLHQPHFMDLDKNYFAVMGKFMMDKYMMTGSIIIVSHKVLSLLKFSALTAKHSGTSL